MAAAPTVSAFSCSSHNHLDLGVCLVVVCFARAHTLAAPLQSRGTTKAGRRKKKRKLFGIVQSQAVVHMGRREREEAQKIYITKSKKKKNIVTDQSLAFNSLRVPPAESRTEPFPRQGRPVSPKHPVPRPPTLR